MKKWFVISILALAQFIMVLDSTVMNVSLSAVTKDLNTTIAALQSAITFYTLTMAAFMLIGGKLGDKWGRLKAFRIGAVIYGLGSFITAISANITMLFIGWSVVEGLGAVLVIPAIASLTADNYKGKDRVAAYALIGMATGIAAAAGPLIGGFFTTYLSWRYVFAGETVVMIGVLLASRSVLSRKITQKIKIDFWSVVLSALGLTTLVFGILQSKVWGWVTPLGKPVIAGHEIAPLGISIVSYLILTGIIILWFFYKRQADLEKARKNPLLRVSLLSVKQLRSGLFVLTSQYLITASLFFVIPVYMQLVLGYDALQTGIKILPLSVGLVGFSIIGSRMSTSTAAKRIVRIGQVLMFVGALIVLSSISSSLDEFTFGAGMFLIGAGMGMLASQLNNVNISSVGNEAASEVGGLQGTSQNLGSSLGTALVGSIMVASLTTGFIQGINANTTIPSSVKQEITQQTETGVTIVSAQQVESFALEKGLPQDQAQSISEDYSTAQLESLRKSVFFIVVFSLLSLLFARNLPSKKP